jgi:hypothetical protein
MNMYLYVIGLLLVGFVVYFLLKDKIFDSASSPSDVEKFEVPALTEVEIRQAPIYPPRTVAPSGPNPPAQAAPGNEIVVYGGPEPKDPYAEPQESSAIPENLRYPERSFRPPPLNTNTSIAVEAGIASNNMQVSSDNSQKFRPDFIQAGGEFMPGIFANDTFSDHNYSAF